MGRQVQRKFWVAIVIAASVSLTACMATKPKEQPTDKPAPSESSKAGRSAKPSRAEKAARAAQIAKAGVEKFPDGSTGEVMDFTSTGGVTISAYIRRPAGKGPFPVVVMLHGAAPSNGYGLGRSTHSPSEDFVNAGWAIYSIDFRHGTSHKGFTGPVLDPIEWEDTANAIKKVRSLPYIDPKRVALMGGSHGANVMARVASRVDASCAVICAPAALDYGEIQKVIDAGKEKVYSNLKKMIHDAEVKYGAKIGVVAKNPERYGYTSAITEAAKVRMPILIINGRNDPASPIPVIDVYVKKLRAAGVEVETYLPDNGPHGFYYAMPREIPETKEAAKHAVAFIKKHFSVGSAK
jgi:dipeptidyl aminopeptidase/acylaminoacyl peptidase